MSKDTFTEGEVGLACPLPFRLGDTCVRRPSKCKSLQFELPCRAMERMRMGGEVILSWDSRLAFFLSRV